MTDERWVVFDYGEVLCRRTAALPELAARLGVAEPEFEAAYWAHRLGYDAGATDLEYWQAVASTAGAGAIDAATSADLVAIDTAGWLDLEPAAIELVTDLAAAGVPLALLSNAPASFGRASERQPWARHFRHLVFSGDLDLVKPQPEIWAALLSRLAAQPRQCVFFDDKPANVAGAAAAGLHAAHWTGAAAARELLTAFGTL